MKKPAKKKKTTKTKRVKAQLPSWSVMVRSGTNPIAWNVLHVIGFNELSIKPPVATIKGYNKKTRAYSVGLAERPVFELKALYAKSNAACQELLNAYKGGMQSISVRIVSMDALDYFEFVALVSTWNISVPSQGGADAAVMTFTLTPRSNIAFGKDHVGNKQAKEWKRIADELTRLATECKNFAQQ